MYTMKLKNKNEIELRYQDGSIFTLYSNESVFDMLRWFQNDTSTLGLNEYNTALIESSEDTVIFKTDK